MLAGMASAGSWFGNIIALPFGGYLCTNGFDGGWPSIFYIFGTLCALWCFIFLFVSADTPQTHWFISDLEKDYIIQETSKVQRSKNQVNKFLKMFKFYLNLIFTIRKHHG